MYDPADVPGDVLCPRDQRGGGNPAARMIPCAERRHSLGLQLSGRLARPSEAKPETPSPGRGGAIRRWALVHPGVVAQASLQCRRVRPRPQPQWCLNAAVGKGVVRKCKNKYMNILSYIYLYLPDRNAAAARRAIGACRPAGDDR